MIPVIRNRTDRRPGGMLKFTTVDLDGRLIDIGIGEIKLGLAANEFEIADAVGVSKKFEHDLQWRLPRNIYSPDHCFDRFMGIPCADRSKGIKDLENCRWVDNYDTFTAVNSRFGAEGAGIPVIYQYEPPKLYYPSVFKGGSVDIRSCHVFTGSQRRKNACVMMLFSLPQKVVFCNNTGPVNNAIFRYAPGFDPAPTLLQLKKSGRDKFVNYVIGWNICMPVPLQETVPEELKQFVRH